MKQKYSLILFLSSLETACGQIGSHAVAFPEQELYRLQPGELVLAASEEDIPSIQTEVCYFVQVEKADLEDTDLLENGIVDFESLTPVPAQLVYWFAWTGFYPDSNIY